MSKYENVFVYSACKKCKREFKGAFKKCPKCNSAVTFKTSYGEDKK